MNQELVPNTPETKEQRVERLKQQIQGWIEITKSNIQCTFDEIHSDKSLEEMGREIDRLGCEASSDQTAYYQWLKTKRANWPQLIEKLRELLKSLEAGEDTVSVMGVHRDVEAEFRKLLVELH